MNTGTRNRKSRYGSALLAILCLIFGAACRHPTQPTQAAPRASTGRLTICIDGGGLRNARTIAPTGYDLAVASYDISGAGPSSLGFLLNSATASTTVLEVRPGDWTVTVAAKNAAGIALGSGTGTVTVLAEQAATVAITLKPLAGNGTLNLNFSWPASIFPSLDTAVLSATLKPTSGTQVDLSTSSFTVNSSARTATYSGPLASGSWDATFRLRASSFTSWSWAQSEALVIVAGQATTAAYDLEATKMNQPPAQAALAVTRVAKPALPAMTVTISWTQPNSLLADGYFVEKRTGSGAYAALGSQLADTAASVADPIGNIGSDQSYSYRIRSLNSWGSSVYSNEATAYTASRWDEATWDVYDWE